MPGTTVAGGVDRLAVSGSTLTANPPFTPGGPPDGRTAPRRITFTIPARSGAGGAPYITTPATCPSTGSWQTSGTFTFDDGVTETVTDATACTAAAGAVTAFPQRPPTAEAIAPSPDRDRTTTPADTAVARSLPSTGPPAALGWTAGALLLLSAAASRRRRSP